MGQIGRTYLVAEGPDGLYLIDQHAAHERVLFEKFLAQHATNESQYLLEPQVVEVPGRLDKDLQYPVEILNHLGFNIENFGPSVYRISAVPVVISQLDPSQAFLSVRWRRTKKMGRWWEDALEAKMITRICKRGCGSKAARYYRSKNRKNYCAIWRIVSRRAPARMDAQP